MKLTSLLMFILLGSMAIARCDAPKSGDSLGTITTTDGKAYAGAKLAVIEPDGISIIYADGGAKIPFTSLSPDQQRQFGYDPDKGAWYAKEQQYLSQIAKLQQENAELRKRLGVAVQQTETSETKPSVAGYHYFLDQMIKASSPMKQSGKGANITVGYSNGPFAGMTQGAAEINAQQQWDNLSHEQQMAWEKSAQFYGDPVAKREALETAEANQPHITVQQQQQPSQPAPSSPTSATYYGNSAGGEIIYH